VIGRSGTERLGRVRRRDGRCHRSAAWLAVCRGVDPGRDHRQVCRVAKPICAKTLTLLLTGLLVAALLAVPDQPEWSLGAEYLAAQGRPLPPRPGADCGLGRRSRQCVAHPRPAHRLSRTQLRLESGSDSRGTRAGGSNALGRS